MGSGFMLSTNEVNVALSTTYTAVTLGFNVAADGKTSFPGGIGKIHGWTLELDLNTASDVTATVARVLTYNASATKGCAGVASAAMTTVTGAAGALAFAEIPFTGGREINWPEGTFTYTAGVGNPTLTLWLKLSAGTANLSVNGARLHFTEQPNG